jgi:hypothetical protein
VLIRNALTARKSTEHWTDFRLLACKQNRQEYEELVRTLYTRALGYRCMTYCVDDWTNAALHESSSVIAALQHG